MDTAYSTIYDPALPKRAVAIQSRQGKSILRGLLRRYLHATREQVGGVNPNLSGLIVRSQPGSGEREYYLKKFGPNTLNIGHFYDNSNHLKKKAHKVVHASFPENCVIDLSHKLNSLDTNDKSRMNIAHPFSLPELKLQFEAPPGSTTPVLRAGDKIVINMHLNRTNSEISTVARGKDLFN